MRRDYLRLCLAIVPGVAWAALWSISPTEARNGGNCVQLNIIATGETFPWQEEGAAQTSAKLAWQRKAAAVAGSAYRLWANAHNRNLTHIVVSKGTIKYRASGTPCRE